MLKKIAATITVIGVSLLLLSISFLLGRAGMPVPFLEEELATFAAPRPEIPVHNASASMRPPEAEERVPERQPLRSSDGDGGLSEEDLAEMDGLQLRIVSGQYDAEDVDKFMSFFYECTRCSNEYFLEHEQKFLRALLQLAIDEATPYFPVHYKNDHSELLPKYEKPLDRWLIGELSRQAQGFLVVGMASQDQRYISDDALAELMEKHDVSVSKQKTRSSLPDDLSPAQKRELLTVVLNDDLAKDRVEGVKEYIEKMVGGHGKLTPTWVGSRFRDAEILRDLLAELALRDQVFLGALGTATLRDRYSPYRVALVFPVREIR